MNGLPTMCAATGICLSLAAVDVVNAKGTFRLQGPLADFVHSEYERPRRAM